MDKQELREAQEEASKLKRLVESPGYEWSKQMVQEDVEGRITRLVSTPPISIEAILAVVHELGICAGLKNAIDRPQMRLDSLEEELEIYKENEDG